MLPHLAIKVIQDWPLWTGLLTPDCTISPFCLCCVGPEEVPHCAFGQWSMPTVRFSIWELSQQSWGHFHPPATFVACTRKGVLLYPIYASALKTTSSPIFCQKIYHLSVHSHYGDVVIQTIIIWPVKAYFSVLLVSTIATLLVHVMLLCKKWVINNIASCMWTL